MIISNCKAVFFDLDDTLCGYWTAAKTGLKQTFQQNLPELDQDSVMQAWILEFKEFCPHLNTLGWKKRYLEQGGTTRTELMRRTLSRLGIDDPATAEKLSGTYHEERMKALVLFPDAKELLEKLAPKFPLGIITNGPADVQREELRSLGIESKFEFFLIEGEMGFGKPEPKVFHRAETLAEASGNQLIMIGNSFEHDIVPAIAFGWKTVWVRRPSDVPPSAGKEATPEPVPVDCPMPDAIVKDFTELHLQL